MSNEEFKEEFYRFCLDDGNKSLVHQLAENVNEPIFDGDSKDEFNDSDTIPDQDRMLPWMKTLMMMTFAQAMSVS